jgi:transposase
MLTYINS